jgi:nucleotide-binding universal stress UspA family protein
MYKKLLVPLDGSILCANALDPAEDLAKRYDAEVILIHVVQYAPIYSEDRIGELSEPDKSEIAVAEQFLSEKAEGLKSKGIKVSCETLVGELPAQEIIEYGRKNSIDLIVLTTHGRSGFSNLWLGSVAERLIRKGTEFASIFVLRCKGE